MGSMNARDIPPSAIATSALKALQATHTKAVLITKDNVSGAVHTLSNHKDAIAIARSVLALNEGALEAAAVALHVFRVKPEGAEAVPEDMDKCAFCGGRQSWDALDEVGRQGHRLVANIVIGAAMSQPVPAGGVKI